MNARLYRVTVLFVVGAALFLTIVWRLEHRRPLSDQLSLEAQGAGTVPPYSEPAVAEPSKTSTASEPSKPESSSAGSTSASKPTPRYPALIDLGMGKCIPCKEMKPILEELKGEYAGRCRVEIIDIGEHPEQADKYGIMVIPTQIFFDKSGREVYRHEGFMPKEDIVAKLAELGVK